MSAFSFDRLSQVNRLVVVSSIDGVAGASACMRVLNNPNIRMDFTEAFKVGSLNPKEWDPDTKVGFIDLGVNNDGKSPETEKREKKTLKSLQWGSSIRS